jgi:polyisoprenoid-binding protein YceI
MKGYFIKIAALFLSVFLTLPAKAVTETYTFDPAHTYVLFHVNHFGFSNPSGKWMAEGQLNLDEKKLQNSTVNVTINMAAIVTGNPELDKHLKSEAFFDVTKFPTATFISSSIDRTGKERALVHGTLTLRGVAKPLTLKVKLNKKGKNPINNKITVGFTATATLSRSDFGIKTLLPGLGNEIKLDIEAEGNR